MRDSIGPVACLSIKRDGSVRNLLNTSRRSALITLRPIQPSEASVAKPANPRPTKMAANANGSHLAVSRLCATRVSSISGSTSQTMAASITAPEAIATTAISPINL